MVDGDGVRAMPGSISIPNSDSLMKRKEKNRMLNGAQQKAFFKTCCSTCGKKTHKKLDFILDSEVTLLKMVLSKTQTSGMRSK
jgi:hypothetical protein